MSTVPPADGAGAPARGSGPSADPIDALLEGRWIDPDTGRAAGVAIGTSPKSRSPGEAVNGLDDPPEPEPISRMR